MKLIPTKQDNYKECDLHQSAVVFHGPNTFHTVSKLIKLCKVNYFCFLKPLQEILTICLAGINWLCERWLFSRCSFCLINLVLIIPAWQMIDMLFHRDDCLYNLIEKMRKTGVCETDALQLVKIWFYMCSCWCHLSKTNEYYMNE